MRVRRNPLTAWQSWLLNRALDPLALRPYLSVSLPLSVIVLFNYI
jgi:hypothetical protein